jgi:malonyl-CoA/methylmalonyl-CoA synthetase
LDEAEYYVQKSNQVVVLSSSAASSLASTVVTSIKKKHVSDIKNITVLSHLRRKKISALSIVISSNPPLSNASAGVVIFTSGTTGKPKGAVLRRSYTHYTAEAIGEGYDIDYNDTLLHVLPVHHTTGLGTSFFPWMVAGGTIEFRSGPKFSPEWIWNRWVQGGITVFSGVPTIYMRLRWHFEQNIANLPEEEKQKFITAVNQMRVLKCGSSALQKDVQVFFTKLRNGRPILTRYGATEFPGCIKVPSNMDPTTLPDDCVGMVVPGVEVKLSNGEAGELLVKSPYMFSR